MPLQLSFAKTVRVDDPDVYINSCCWGGDAVSDRLLPMVRERYSSVRHGQEDWGWFIWFKHGKAKLAIDIHCDDATAGEYRIILTSRVKPSLFGYRVIDSAELADLRDQVRRELGRWVDGEIAETLLDKHCDPVDS